MICADCEKECCKKGSCNPLEDFALMHYISKNIYMYQIVVWGHKNVLNKQLSGINYQIDYTVGRKKRLFALHGSM